MALVELTGHQVEQLSELLEEDRTVDSMVIETLDALADGFVRVSFYAGGWPGTQHDLEPEE